MSAIVVLVTAPRGPPSARIARDLVQNRLAACVNIVPGVRSLYFWEGKSCDDREDLLVIKSTRGAFTRLKARVLAIHPYSLPEVIALPVTAGHRAYLDWVARGSRDGKAGTRDKGRGTRDK